MDNKIIGQHQFHWRIENFSACTEKTKFYIESPVIRSADLDNSFWTLMLAPRGEIDGGFISVKLKRSSEDDGPTDLLLELEFCLIDLYGKEHFNVQETFLFTKSDTFEIFSFVKRESLFEDKDKLLPNDVLTLQCRASKVNSGRFVATRSVFHTKIHVDRSTFVWTIRGFTGKASMVQKAIRVDSKRDPNILNLLCKCSGPIDQPLAPGEKRVLHISMQSKEVFRSRVFARVKIQALQNPSIKVEVDCFFMATFNSLLTEFDISDMVESILREDRLDLSCEISISNGVLDNQTEGSLIPLIDKFYLEEPTLLQDLKTVYEENINTDVMVKAYNGNKHFWAHKTILSARCSAFRLILNEFDSAKKSHFVTTGFNANNPARPNDVRVNNENLKVWVVNGVDYVEVYNTGTQILDQVLRCIYTDFLSPDSFSNGMSLYSAGIRFDFKLLKQKSEHYLKTQISLQSLRQILVFAHCNYIVGLKSECMNFITENKEIILASDELTYLRDTHEDLASEINKIFNQR